MKINRDGARQRTLRRYLGQGVSPSVEEGTHAAVEDRQRPAQGSPLAREPGAARLDSPQVSRTWSTSPNERSWTTRFGRIRKPFGTPTSRRSWRSSTTRDRTGGAGAWAACTTGLYPLRWYVRRERPPKASTCRSIRPNTSSTTSFSSSCSERSQVRSANGVKQSQSRSGPTCPQAPRPTGPPPSRSPPASAQRCKRRAWRRRRARRTERPAQAKHRTLPG